MVQTYSNKEQQTTQATPTRAQALDEKIAELVDIIRANQYRIERLEMRNQRAKAKLYELLEQRGENWADEEGYARLVAEGERASYDTSALDNLIVDDPLRYGWLKDYRRKSRISGGVRVK